MRPGSITRAFLGFALPLSLLAGFVGWDSAPLSRQTAGRVLLPEVPRPPLAPAGRRLPPGRAALPADSGQIAPHGAGDTVHVALEVTGDWGTGLQAEVRITNNAHWVIWDWLLEFDLAHTIDSIWDAEIIENDGDHYGIAAIQAGWQDGDLDPGETARFGFIASPGGSGDLPRWGTLNGTRVVFNSDSPAPPPLVPRDPPVWPAHHFAPYVDVTLWPPFDLAGTAQREGVRFYSLGFVVADPQQGCTPSWGGYEPTDCGFLLPEINAVRDLRGDVMVSFGGASGTPLAVACPDPDVLATAYRSVIDAYRLTHIDFDVEGIWTADPPSIQRRSRALARLQQELSDEGRTIEVWFTLPVLPTGLTADGLAVVQSALDEGVDLTGINVMAMDYGDDAAPDPDGRMGEYAIEAATSLFAQLDTLYAGVGLPKTDAELWRMIGITPMIGLNDIITELFYQQDAVEVLDFALTVDLGRLAFWSANRDVECPGGEQAYVSPDCSSILQEPFEFTQIFLPYTR